MHFEFQNSVFNFYQNSLHLFILSMTLHNLRGFETVNTEVNGLRCSAAMVAAKRSVVVTSVVNLGTK